MNGCLEFAALSFALCALRTTFEGNLTKLLHITALLVQLKNTLKSIKKKRQAVWGSVFT